MHAVATTEQADEVHRSGGWHTRRWRGDHFLFLLSEGRSVLLNPRRDTQSSRIWKRLSPRAQRRACIHTYRDRVSPRHTSPKRDGKKSNAGWRGGFDPPVPRIAPPRSLGTLPTCRLPSNPFRRGAISQYSMRASHSGGCRASAGNQHGHESERHFAQIAFCPPACPPPTHPLLLLHHPPFPR